MEMDKPGPVAASGCLASLPSDPGTAAGLAPGPTSGSLGAASALQRRVDSKKNTKKRHSFTALSVTHRSTQAAGHRRSMEISAPVLISSSDPRAAARIGDLAHLSCSAPTQVTAGVGLGPGAPSSAPPGSCALVPWAGEREARQWHLLGSWPQSPPSPGGRCVLVSSSV